MVIPLKPPSKNELRPDPRVIRRGARVIPCAYLRWKGLERDWSRCLRRPREDQRALGRRRVQFIRLMTRREKRMDRWNLEGGLNLVVVDLLVQVGWLIDDDEASAEMLPAVQRLAGPDEIAPATYIELEDLPGPAAKIARLPGV